MDVRQYDPTIARWTGIDPVTHHSMSTYTAFDNNPIYWADPSGANSEDLVNEIIKKSSGYSSSTWKSNDDGTFSSSKGRTAGTKSDGGDPPNKFKQYFDAKAQQYEGVLNNIDPIGQVNRGMKEGAKNFFPDMLKAPAPKMDWLDWLLGPIGLMTKKPFEFGQSVTNRVIEGDNFRAGYSLGSAFTGSAVTAGIGIGLRGISGVSLTTPDGFLFRGFNIKAPFNIPVQRFGQMGIGRSDFWGLRIGTNRFVNRVFAAIKPSWNPLTQYTTGIIPKGTPMRFGVIGPQGVKFIGGSMQFITQSKNVINQSSKVIQR